MGPPYLIDTCICRRHLPNDLGRGRSLDDPSSENRSLFGSQAKRQSRNHFQRIDLDRTAVLVELHAASIFFAQNAALADQADIGTDGRYEYAEQISDLVFRQPYAAARRTNGHSVVFDGYELHGHLHVIQII